MPNDKDIALTIVTPRGPFTGSFPKTTKVSDVIEAVIAAVGLAPDERFDLVHNGTVLQPVERPIVSFGLADGDQLELVATGSGV